MECVRVYWANGISSLFSIVFSEILIKSNDYQHDFEHSPWEVMLRNVLTYPNFLLQLKCCLSGICFYLIFNQTWETHIYIEETFSEPNTRLQKVVCLWKTSS
ncbi:hypothetical protein RIF29_41491 [Crotalaria pallida]|uniref:Uncharacterized protein n=1 Tax=Crotalaria pallida TaxID=3830 RepID=A0AAN9E5T0_CROPI